MPPWSPGATGRRAGGFRSGCACALVRPVCSVSPIGKRRFSDVDVERARALRHYALHRASADAQHLADLQCARAALAVMPRRSSSAFRSPCFLLVLDDFMKQDSALDALAVLIVAGPRSIVLWLAADFLSQR